MKTGNSLLKKPMRHEIFVLIVLGVMVVAFSLLSDTFLSANNLLGILRKSTELQLLAFGMMGAIIAGGIDLSIGALCSFNTVVIAMLHTQAGLPLPLALVLALCVSLAIGLLNGVLIGILKIAPMLATLGMQAVLLGAGLVLTSGSVVSGFSDSYVFLGNGRLFGVIPAQLLLLVPVIIALSFVYGKFKMGRQIYLVGTNPQVAEYTGISESKTIIKVYLLGALMAFLAAVVLSSRLASGRPDVANSYVMPAIGACVVGGVSIKGGKGSVIGVVLGVLMFMTISNGLLQFVNENAVFYENVFTGLIILGILCFRTLKSGKLKVRKS